MTRIREEEEEQRLDKFWIDQDVMYNYKADLHGIGNRSIIV